jgi:hypothetical protein
MRKFNDLAIEVSFGHGRKLLRPCAGELEPSQELRRVGVRGRDDGGALRGRQEYRLSLLLTAKWPQTPGGRIAHVTEFKCPIEPRRHGADMAVDRANPPAAGETVAPGVEVIARRALEFQIRDGIIENQVGNPALCLGDGSPAPRAFKSAT